MLTLEDCVGLCELNKEEIDAIARHEHLPEIIAVEMADYLCRTHDGRMAIKRIIIDDIEDARRRGARMEVLTLIGVLKHFVDTHPDVGK